MTNKKGTAAAEETPKFEESLERLETIVQELEGGALTLDESLARYEEGVRLSKRLTQELDQAQKRIERLNDEGEPPGTRPFALETETSPRGSRPDEGELPF